MLALSIFIISGLVFLATKGQDRNAIETSVHLARSALAAAERRLSNTVLDYAYWDQAVENLVTNFDPEWAEGELGPYLLEAYDVSTSYVLGAGNEIIYSSKENPDPFGRFGHNLEILVSKARSGSKAAAPIPVAGLVADKGLLYIVSVAVLTTYFTKDGEDIDEGTDHLLLLVRRINENLLSELATSYQLHNLRLQPSADFEAVASLPLYTADGKQVERLVWEPDLPGQNIFVRLIFGILVAFVALSFLVFHILRRTKAFSQQLEEKSELLTSTLNSIDQGIASWDHQDRLLTWNRKCEDFWYFPPNIRRGMTKLELLEHLAKEGRLGSDTSSEAAEKRYLQLQEEGVNSSEEFNLHDGRHISLFRYPMPRGGHTVVYSDETDRKNYEEGLNRAKQAAERAEHRKAVFLANVSHELRTPLNSILGFSELLLGNRESGLKDEQIDEYSKIINSSGQHLLDQVNQILDLSKIDAGKLILENANLNIRDIVKYSATFVSQQIMSKEQYLELDIPDDFPSLYADRTALSQIMINLLSNAVKFTPEQGIITVTATSGEDGIRLAVTDNGEGMDEELLQNVLEPFMQAKDTRSHPQEGTGLGLSIVKSLVELHDGTLELQSEPGKGTTVTLSFPSERMIPVET